MLHYYTTKNYKEITGTAFTSVQTNTVHTCLITSKMAAECVIINSTIWAPAAAASICACSTSSLDMRRRPAWVGCIFVLLLPLRIDDEDATKGAPADADAAEDEEYGYRYCGRRRKGVLITATATGFNLFVDTCSGFRHSDNSSITFTNNGLQYHGESCINTAKLRILSLSFSISYR